MGKNIVEDGILYNCPDLEYCRNIWASDAIQNKSCCLFNCRECVGYKCYFLGYSDAWKERAGAEK